MKIIMRREGMMSLQEFADKYGLVMVISERDQKYVQEGAARFYASLEGVAIKDNEVSYTYGMGGTGETPKSAMDAYANVISKKTITFYDAAGNKKEVLVPNLYYEYE